MENFTQTIDATVHPARLPWYLISDSWLPTFTFLALIVAFVVPWVANCLNNRPRKSKLKVTGKSVVDQANESYDPDIVDTHLVGRLVIQNKGRYIARSVEASLEKIICEGEDRRNFFPVPLFWTHGQVNKGIIRDIYPNQTVYLDVFEYIWDSLQGESMARFSLGAGRDIENLSFVSVGKSNLLLKLYQESGQVDKIRLEISWEGKGEPEMTIL